MTEVWDNLILHDPMQMHVGKQTCTVCKKADIKGQMTWFFIFIAEHANKDLWKVKYINPKMFYIKWKWKLMNSRGKGKF